MQPLYTQDQFLKAKSLDKLPLQCLHCKKTFFREKRILIGVINGRRSSKYNFCSLKCRNDVRHPPMIVHCEQCQKSFRKHPKEIKKCKHNFCSRSCSCTYHNTHKSNGTRISKLEVWLSKQLPVLYPNLELHFNKKDAIDSELDIYIPSLKLAFELNGIFHYEPIYGTEKLSSTQNNDGRKYQACIEHGIELCIIDTSHQNYFKEQTSIKFLKIIKNIINIRLSQS